MRVKSRVRKFLQPATPDVFAQQLRAATSLALLCVLAACASRGPAPTTITEETATYIARAKPSYAPPGPPEDPWGPYVAEAAQRFDVPQLWIRQVMRVESHGQQFTPTGVLTTSPVGAMGLMQIMPETYDEVRARYNLSDDAFDPHNNILAGTAYLREMYDAFGSPGFLAAYNGGPARLEDYLTHQKPLPLETRRYVAIIAPRIQGIWPASRSPAEQYAVNQLPINIPAGPRYVVRHTSVLLASRTRHGRAQVVRYAVNDRHRGRNSRAAPIEVAEAPEPRVSGTHSTTRVAYATSVAHHGGLHLISTAMASESMGRHDSSAAWAIQVGAYGNANQAHQAAGAAQYAAGHAHLQVATVKSGHATLYRARLSGMTHDAAVHACKTLSHGHAACLVVSPAAT